MTLYTCAHCPESFRYLENAQWHEKWCGIVGGETREIPGISLISGASNGVGNADYGPEMGECWVDAKKPRNARTSEASVRPTTAKQMEQTP